MQQHAEPVGDLQSAAARGGQQRRLQRHIDEIGDHGGGRQQADVDRKRRLAMHAERRGIHQQARARQHLADRLPGDRMHVAELVGQRAGAIERSVGQMHALDAALEQSEHHRARRAAGAQHQRVGGLVPSGCAGVEIVDEALDVGVGRAQFAVLVPQRVGGADGAGAFIGLCQCQRALLVRQGDVGADEAAQRQPEHEILELVGWHRLDDVAARDPERAQPVMMDQRRARMRRRPSDQAGGGGVCFGCHRRSRCGAGSGRRQGDHASRRRCQCRYLAGDPEIPGSRFRAPRNDESWITPRRCGRR